ncbi:hypothetical protein NDU88_002561 [Pleurodeles waltl]|uniref:Uncharacterized protein n=1 Tax=Pleurodeles waltl TaxID=8319 RepID=A0AAV7MT60_PLEWA|nr:hypothetical protein NDU88_002561 [Pleurodeles waltl]
MTTYCGSAPALRAGVPQSSHKVLDEPDSALQQESVSPRRESLRPRDNIWLASKELPSPVLRTVQLRSLCALLSFQLR